MTGEMFKAILPGLNDLVGQMFEKHFDNFKTLKTQSEYNPDADFIEYKIFIPKTITLKG